jgi:hypothetical protein
VESVGESQKERKAAKKESHQKKNGQKEKKRKYGKNIGKKLWGKRKRWRKERTLSTPPPRPILLQGSSLPPAPALAPLSLFRRCRRALQVHFLFRFRTDKENWSEK